MKLAILLVFVAACVTSTYAICPLGYVNAAPSGQPEKCCANKCLNILKCHNLGTCYISPDDCSATCRCPILELDSNNIVPLTPLGDPVISLTGEFCDDCAPGWAQNDTDVFRLLTGMNNCNVNIDECASSPCQNGVCHDMINGYVCECTAGYHGTHCEHNSGEGGTTGGTPPGEI